MDEKNIGTLSKFIGVSRHTIKYYEKIGLLDSIRDEQSNYRRFHLRVCTDIAECVKFKRMEFSLKDIDILRKSADNAMFQNMLSEQLQKLNQEVERITKIRDEVQEYYNENQRLERCLGSWYIEQADQIFYMRIQTDNLEYSDTGLEADGINLMDWLPRTKSIAVLSKDYLNGGEQKFHWGMGIGFSSPQLPFEQSDHFLKVRMNRVFVTYARYREHYISDEEMPRHLRKIFREYTDTFPNDAYAIRIKIVQEEENWHYFKIMIPLD